MEALPLFQVLSLLDALAGRTQYSMRHMRASYQDPRQGRGLLLFDVLLKDFANLLRALLGVPFLAALVIDVGDAEAGFVAFGPFKVTA